MALSVSRRVSRPSRPMVARSPGGEQEWDQTLSGVAAHLEYAAAIILLLLSAFTEYPLAAARKLDFRIHGFIELVIGVALLIAPYVLGYANELIKVRNFDLIMGLLLVVVWLFTNYKATLPTEGDFI